VNPSGKGFIITKEEAEAMLADDRRNADVVRPFLNGAELNASTSGTGDRFVIDFQDWPKERARSYRLPWKRVEETVAPQRAAERLQVHESDFWKFEDKRPDLREQLAKIDRAIVFSEVSKYFSFAFAPSNFVFSPSLRVVPTADALVFGTLQSTIHMAWAHEYQYTLKGDPRYSIGACFRTYPFAICDEQQGAMIRDVAEKYHSMRAELMRKYDLGLRTLYDSFHDSSASTCQALRDLQVKLDLLLASAYGWGDLDMNYGFFETKQGTRYTFGSATRKTVLARLLQLNHDRYNEEVRLGLHEKKKPKGKRVVEPSTRGLFD